MVPTNKISVDYAFTFTLRPKMYVKESEKQYDETALYVKTKLAAECYQFTLVAEQTTCFNIHYHGICNLIITDKCKDPLKRIHDAFRNDTYIGFIKVRQIDNMPVWKEYCLKSLNKTQVSLNRRPLLYDDYNICNSEGKARYGCSW